MKVKIDTLRTGLFCASMALTTFTRVFVKIRELTPIFNLMAWISIVICVAILLIRKTYVKKDAFLMVSLLIAGVVNAILTSDYELLRVGFILAAFKGQSFKKYILYDIGLKLMVIFTACVLCSFGIAKDFILYEDGTEKHSYGFSNPNMLAVYIFMIALEAYYLIRNTKLRRRTQMIIHFVVCMTSISIIRLVCGSRTCAFLGIILLLIGVAQIAGLKLRNIMRFSRYAFIVLTIISIAFAGLYASKNSFAISVNELLTGRLRWMSEYIDYYGYSIGGKAIAIYDHVVYKDGIAFMCVDNAYIYILLKFGILAWLVFAYLFWCIASDRKDNNIKMIIVITAIFGFTEASIIKPQINPFLLAGNNKNE